MAREGVLGVEVWFASHAEWECGVQAPRIGLKAVRRVTDAATPVTLPVLLVERAPVERRDRYGR
jgi:hypothetical protein